MFATVPTRVLAHFGFHGLTQETLQTLPLCKSDELLPIEGKQIMLSFSNVITDRTSDRAIDFGEFGSREPLLAE